MSNDPVLIAYAGKRSRDRKRTYWKRIGCAYPHETGAGLTVVLDVLPLDGRIFLFELDADDDKRLLKQAQRNQRS
jgi:hypothetical protein